MYADSDNGSSTPTDGGTSARVVLIAEDLAKQQAMKDRTQYAGFMERIEEFASRHGMIVGGASATRALLGASEPDLESFYIELFSDHPQDHARELTNILFNMAPLGLGHYATLIARV